MRRDQLPVNRTCRLVQDGVVCVQPFGAVILQADVQAIHCSHVADEPPKYVTASRWRQPTQHWRMWHYGSRCGTCSRRHSMPAACRLQLMLHCPLGTTEPKRHRGWRMLPTRLQMFASPAELGSTKRTRSLHLRHIEFIRANVQPRAAADVAVGCETKVNIFE
jgi:hypothetical protein